MGDGVNKFKQGLYLEPQSSDLSNPAEGDVMFSDGTARAKGLWIYKDGAWVEAGSSGSGGINYLDGDNSDFENGVGDWVAYADAAATTPADGTGGAPTTTFAQSADTTLRGSNNGLLTKAAANDQGEGASCAFTIDEADQAKKLTISFDYTTSANYADDDIGVFIYDVTNTTLIRVNGEDLKANASSATHYAQFQAAPDSTSYRLILHIASTNASAYTCRFDNVKVGPKELAYGAIITDWEDYTPTYSGFGTVTISDMQWRRVGSNLEGFGSFDLGTPTATEAQLGLPNGLTVGTGQSNALLVGQFARNNITTDTFSLLATDGDTFINFAINQSGSYNVTVPTTGTNVANTGEKVYIKFSVPIQGWSSNAQISEDLGGRKCAIYARTGNGHGSTNTKIRRFSNIDNNTGGAVTYADSSTLGATFTINETGIYSIHYTDQHSGTASSGISRNSSQLTTNIYSLSDASESLGYTTMSNGAANISWSGQLTKGDVIRPHGDGISTGTTHTRFSIVKIGEPQTLLETETVAARYTTNAGQSISNNSLTVVVFEDVENDTHNAYNTSTGVYTVPVSGWYYVDAHIKCSGTFGDNKYASTYFYLNGTGVHIKDREMVPDGGATVLNTYQSSMIKYLDKGDTLDFRFYQNSGGSLNLTTVNGECVFSIARIK